MACAISGATAVMATSVCSGQIALDRATDPAYASGWSDGQNGGYGFGAWSFAAGNPSPAGQYQGTSTSSPLGTAWTLLTHSTSSGLANAGRAINGGLGVGETFETVIENPSVYTGYRGWDISFLNSTHNNGPGTNASSLYLNVYNGYAYTGLLQNWHVTDGSGPPGTQTSLNSSNSAVKGMKLDLTLTSATTYALTLTSLDGAPVYSQNGTLSGPINWVDFRLYSGASGGLTDTANNFGISYMEVVPEPSTFALIVLGMSGFWCLRRRK
jgi:hypothetical protein